MQKPDIQNQPPSAQTSWQQGLRICPGFSWVLLGLLLLMYSGALFSLWLIDVSTMILSTATVEYALKLLLTLWLLSKAKRDIQHHVLWQNRQLPACMMLQAEGIRTRDDQLATILPDSYVQPWLIVLNLRWEGGRESVVLFPDALAAECFRHLRVRLRYEIETDETKP
ncbi:protein YgfX [Candidatus Venteria ishoeyi]|uniref:Toxin CptA n=1 Tax=Candidatus Venteria ishoeyi TaxID=1899563 RepID=A0A1H6FB22_9GAMM|nr:protein YgfX [Candidatus Venteria ishoeyi]MDM8546502.1 hypothetical protein [Candidatus Venteria ishoeyi]SEH06326.1 Uncharacterised protein [Candidatus Venteria ishoeyi]